MEKNIYNLINQEKVTNKDGDPIIVKNDNYIEEEIIDKNSDVTTICPERIKDKYEKKEITEEEKLINEEKKINNEFKLHNSNYYVNGGEKERIIRKLEKRRKDGVKVEFDKSESIQRLKKLSYNLEMSIEKEKKVDFLWYTMWGICYLVEKFVTKFGYGLQLNGWSEEVYDHKEDYVRYLNMMVSDTIVTDVKTGEKMIIKNTSFIANIEISPFLLLIMNLFKNAILYTGINNFSNIAKVLNNDSNKEDKILESLPIPKDNDSSKEINKKIIN